MQALLSPAVAVAVAAALVLTGCAADDAPAATPSSTSPPAAAAPAPHTWERTSPRLAGFDPAVLRQVVRANLRTGSTCLAVVRDGRLVGDWYGERGTSDGPAAAFSVTKSITSTLVGIAQDDGLLDIDDRASEYIEAWRGTPSRTVTIRNLLSNDSGRQWSLMGDYAGLITADDRTAYAVGLGQEAPPGRQWAYNNAAIQTLDAVLRAATGQDTGAFAEERLFGPLGMADTRMTGDGTPGSASTAFGLETTCLDLARFGLLFAQDGRWEGEQLLSREWVDEAVGRSSQDLNAAYGLLWWVNRSGPVLSAVPDDEPPRVGRLFEGLAPDAFAALGAGGQVVLVDPGSHTVVVRMRDATSGEPASDAAVTRVLTDASTS